MSAPAGARDSRREHRGGGHAVWEKIRVDRSIATALFAAGMALSTPQQARAIIALPLGPEAAAGASLGTLLACEAGSLFDHTEPVDCEKLAEDADPPAPGVTEISITLQYNSSLLTFDPGASGFLCQFSANGDCPPANAPGPGTFQAVLLPSSGYTPGQPLPGSTVVLVVTGDTVSLTYTLPSPVTADEDTNFFSFVFDFIHPIEIDLKKSTVTYGDATPGATITQTNFVCQTDVIPDLGCGSDDAVTAVTLNLHAIPEPATWLMFGIGFVGLLGYRKAFSRGSAAGKAKVDRFG